MTRPNILIRHGKLLSRVAFVVAALVVIVAVFFLSNTATISWSQRENLKDQVRADVRAAVAVIKDQPLGSSNFTLVNAPNDNGVPYRYTSVVSGGANVLEVKHNQAMDNILVLPLTGKGSGAMDSGSTLRGYRIVGVSLSNLVENYTFTYNSKTGEYSDGTFDTAAGATNRFVTEDATATLVKQGGATRLVVSTSALLNPKANVQLPGFNTLNNLDIDKFTARAGRLTAFGLQSPQAALYSKSGEEIKLCSLKWDVAYIVSKAPQFSQVQVSTTLPDTFDAQELKGLAGGGYLKLNYRGLTGTLKIQDRIYQQDYMN